MRNDALTKDRRHAPLILFLPSHIIDLWLPLRFPPDANEPLARRAYRRAAKSRLTLEHAMTSIRIEHACAAKISGFLLGG